MVDKQRLKQEFKRIKDMLRKVEADDLKLLHSSLEIIYERISNRKDKDYGEIYSLLDILSGKDLKEISKFNKGKGVIFEFVAYDNVIGGFVIIYNVFAEKRNFPTSMDVYILKE